MLLSEKDKRIHEIDKRDLKIVRLEIKNVKLQESVKLLPDGKKPVRIRKEWDQARNKVKAAADILSELKKYSCFRFFKRKKLLAELEKLLSV